MPSSEALGYLLRQRGFFMVCSAVFLIVQSLVL